MDTFETSFQHPLEAKPRQLGTLTAFSAMQQFKSIDWLQLNQDVHNPGDIVVEDFYFFEAKRPGDKHMQPLLCVSGQPSTDQELQASGPMCQIDHFYLETTISKGFLGFGGGKSKQELSQRTMANCTPEFAEKCLEAFLNADADFLDKELIDNAPSLDDD